MGERCAAAFDDVHGESAVGGAEQEAQRRRRRLASGLRRAEQDGKTRTRLGGKLQPAEVRIARFAWPGKHCAADAGAQRLLGGPQCLLRRAGPDDEQPREIDARCGERWRVGEVGRRDPRQATPCACEARERRPEQTQLADPLVPRQDLGERACRPTAAGQLGVERGEAAGNARHGDAAELGAAPDIGSLQDRVQERRHDGPGSLPRQERRSGRSRGASVGR